MSESSFVPKCRFNLKMKKIVALLFTVALMATAHAQTPAQFAALQAQVVALQKQVTTLQQNKALALAPFVSVDPNPQNGVRGPNITFHDANIHITNGSFNTATVNGLGNLIIGYNEIQQYPNNVLVPGDRGGSHNLVIGPLNKFTLNSYCSIVAGYDNKADACFTAVLAGADNTVSGQYGALLGGTSNTVFGLASVGGGGYACRVFGDYSTLWGGKQSLDTSIKYASKFGDITP